MRGHLKEGDYETHTLCTQLLGPVCQFGLRALQVLERIGTVEARRLAETLARDTSGRLADEAQSTVLRMTK